MQFLIAHFSQPPVISSFLSGNMPSGILYSNIVCVSYSLNTRQQVSHLPQNYYVRKTLYLRRE